MKIQLFTYILVLLFSIQNIQCQKTIYISSSGDNNNNGLSEKTPIKSISSAISGNTYLFKSGDTFYFPIKNLVKNGTGSSKSRLSSYGSGNKPIISQYTHVDFSTFEKSGTNIWRTNLKGANSFSGNGKPNTNVGFIKIGKTIYGNKLNDVTQLTKNWDFYTDNSYLYIYHDQHPTQNFPIDIASDGTLLILWNNLTVSNLNFMGIGGHAINGANCKNVTLENINISEIGGSYLQGYKNGLTRYGNGIQFWKGGTDCLVKSCSISNVYDAALTMQGDGADFKNITFTDNYLSDNEQSFEFWVNSKKSGFVNCQFINNKCYNAGFGWSHKVRPNKNMGVHILNYAFEVSKSEITIENNIFKNAASGLIYYNKVNKNKTFISKNNTIYLADSTPIRSQHPESKIRNAKAFTDSSKLEKGSKFEKLD